MSAPLTGVPPVPAMTTDAERECYYRLVREGAGKGAIMEFGAWLGASTAYIAAGIRDSGVDTKVHVYDHFISKAGHADKVTAFFAETGADGPIPLGGIFDQFKANLGPLFEYVEPHPCEISQVEWDGSPIAVLITDAPKRVREIVPVLTRLRGSFLPGAIMAWQDFCHFPSFEIAACLYRLRHRMEFVEAVVPGSTMVFRVTSQMTEAEVSKDALAVSRWTAGEIEQAWAYWLDGYVPAEKASLFRCGAAMFLCDIGEPEKAAAALAVVIADDPDAVLPKWRYLREKRADFVKRYAPLFALFD